MQKRYTRNRKRSRRRAICCLEHGCDLDSVSPEYPLYKESAAVLQLRGISRRAALTLAAASTASPLQRKWLEAFWYEQCQETRWYHIYKVSDRAYAVRPAPNLLWQQASDVIHPDGNVAASEYMQGESRRRAFGKLPLVN